jgi:hypothetical protein
MTFEINWSGIDPKYNWVAIDRDGQAYAYINEPKFLATFEEWVDKDEGYNHYKLLDQTFEFGGEDHIYKRPEKVEAIGHKHAKLMLEYAQDALVNKIPSNLWEYSFDGVHWESLGASNPMWDVDHFYRRKSTLISVEIPLQHKEAVEAYIKSLE